MLCRVYFPPGNDRLVTTCVPGMRLLEILEDAFDQQSAASKLLQVSQLSIGWDVSAKKMCHITRLQIGHPSSTARPSDFNGQEVRVVLTQLQYKVLEALNATNAECDQKLGSLMDILSSNTALLGVAPSSGKRGVFSFSGPSLSCPGTTLACRRILHRNCDDDCGS